MFTPRPCLFNTTSFVYISEAKVRLTPHRLPKLGHPPCLLTSRVRRRQFSATFVYILRYLFTYHAKVRSSATPSPEIESSAMFVDIT